MPKHPSSRARSKSLGHENKPSRTAKALKAIKKRARSPSPAESEPGLDKRPIKRGRTPQPRSSVGRSGSVASTASAMSPKPKSATLKTTFNALQKPASHPRPARQLFIFGNGGMGQFGLGTGVLDEIPYPKLHSWFEAAVAADLLGGPKAGLEKVCAGGMHTLAIDEVGRVWSWGLNDFGSLGRPTLDVRDPDRPDQILEPEVLETQPVPIMRLVEEDFRAVDIAAGECVSVALGSHGQLRIWGTFRSLDGPLGFDGQSGTPKVQINPLSLPSLQQSQFVSVACGTDHVVALANNGHVYVWGNGQLAQLGRKIIERRKVNGLLPERLALRRIVYIGSGNYHSFAIDHKGVVYAWGLNNYRQTGVSEERAGAEAIVPVPTQVDALLPERLGGNRKVVAISGGEHHTLFLLNDGSVWGCGRCDSFELGLGDDHPAMKDSCEQLVPSSQEGESEPLEPPEHAYVPEPVPIPFPPPPTVDDPDPPAPAYDPSFTRKAPLNPMVQVDVGKKQNLAVSTTGVVYSWGDGSQCELGAGSQVKTRRTPRRVMTKDMEGWIIEAASAGTQHCVLLGRRVGAVDDEEPF